MTAPLATPQEVRMLRLLAEGYSYQAVADRFDITINTVRHYIRSIYEKLHAHSKSDGETPEAASATTLRAQLP